MRILSGSMVFGAGLLALAALTSPAKAAYMVDSGPSSAGSTDNVVFTGCTGTPLGTANSVSGCLNTDGSYMVHFEEDTEPLIAPAIGQARVEADADGFDFLRISADTDFARLTTDINSLGVGYVVITVYDDTGLVLTSGNLTLGTGSNFFNIYATEGDLISYIEFEAFDAAIGSIVFEDFRQTRIGVGAPDDPQSVSEPTTIALFGLSLLGLGLAARRRRVF